MLAPKGTLVGALLTALLASLLPHAAFGSQAKCRNANPITISSALVQKFGPSEVGLDWTCFDGALEDGNDVHFKIQVDATNVEGLALQLLAYNSQGGMGPQYQFSQRDFLSVQGPGDAAATDTPAANVRTAQVDNGSIAFVAYGLELQDLCAGQYLVRLNRKNTPAGGNMQFGLLARVVAANSAGDYPPGPALGRPFTPEYAMDPAATSPIPTQLMNTGSVAMGTAGAFVTRSTMVWGDELAIPIGEEWASAKRMMKRVRLRLEGPAGALLNDAVANEAFPYTFALTGGFQPSDQFPNNVLYTNRFLINGTADSQMPDDLPEGFVEYDTGIDYMTSNPVQAGVSVSAPSLSGARFAVGKDASSIVGKFGSAGIFADMRVLLVSSEDYPTLDLRSGGSRDITGTIFRSGSPGATNPDPDNQFVFAVLAPVLWSNMTFSAVATTETILSNDDDSLRPPTMFEALDIIDMTYLQARPENPQKLGTAFANTLDATSSALSTNLWSTTGARSLWGGNGVFLNTPTDAGVSIANGIRFLVRATLNANCAENGQAWPNGYGGGRIDNATVKVTANMQVLTGECNQHSDCMVKRANHPGKDRMSNSDNSNPENLHLCRVHSEPLAGASNFYPVSRCIECVADDDCEPHQYCQRNDPGICTSAGGSMQYICDSDAYNTYGMCRDRTNFDAIGLRCRNGARRPNAGASESPFSTSATAVTRQGTPKGWANGNGYCGGLKFYNSTALGQTSLFGEWTQGDSIRAVHWEGYCFHGKCLECGPGSSSTNGVLSCLNGRYYKYVDSDTTVHTLAYNSPALSSLFIALAVWIGLFLFGAYMICESNRHAEAVSGGTAQPLTCMGAICGVLCCMPTCYSFFTSCNRGGMTSKAAGGSDEERRASTSSPSSRTNPLNDSLIAGPSSGAATASSAGQNYGTQGGSTGAGAVPGASPPAQP